MIGSEYSENERMCFYLTVDALNSEVFSILLERKTARSKKHSLKTTFFISFFKRKISHYFENIRVSLCLFFEGVGEPSGMTIQRNTKHVT